MDQFDYLKYYDDERYLLEEVGPKFRVSGSLEATDFLMILVWKANRAVTHHIRRLRKLGNCSFAEATGRIAASLHSRSDRKERLQVLISDWEFALPTATAVLAMLYPHEFTVYDIVVCEQLRHAYKPNLYAGDSWWDEYESYHNKVVASTPSEFCLRDKDRYLTGQSYYKWLQDMKKDELDSTSSD